MVLVFEMTDPLCDLLKKADDMARRELIHLRGEEMFEERAETLRDVRRRLHKSKMELSMVPPGPCAHSSVDYNVRLYGTPELATYGDRCQKCDKVVRFNN